MQRRHLLSGVTAGGIGAAVLAGGLALPGRARAQTAVYKGVDCINLLLKFAADEVGHVTFLRNALGTRAPLVRSPNHPPAP